MLHPPLQSKREGAWLCSDYALVDAFFYGVDGEGSKKEITNFYGFAGGFGEAAPENSDLLKELMDDLPQEWDVRCDVSSRGYLLSMATALERPVPSMVTLDVESAKGPCGTRLFPRLHEVRPRHSLREARRRLWGVPAVDALRCE